MSNSTLWYIARGTGMVTVGLLSVSVALGIVNTMRWSTPSWPRFVAQYVHRNVSLLAMSFLAVHIVTTVVDTASPVRLVDAIVPFTGTYRPLAVGLGVVAFDLLAALVITSLLRPHIGYRAWRAVHWTAYACWPFAMLHGITAGTDTPTSWARGVYLACAALVVAAVAWRVAAAIPPAAAPATAPVRSQGARR
jgi:sulfoxide reductase heme-binding subunit YedZ